MTRPVWRNGSALRSPELLTFSASLALSAIALSRSTLNRDGMLYTEAARAFLDGGLPAAQAVFNWPFLSIAMAWTASLTGLSHDLAGNVINAIFMALACATMVSMVQRQDPALAPLAGLVVLALPGLNEYRGELLREYGAWCFALLALRMASHWPQRPTLGSAIGIQGLLGVAVLFRPESAVFFLAVLIWQHFEPSPVRPWRRLLALGFLPGVAFALLFAAYLLGALPAGTRLSGDLGRFDYMTFDRTARQMAMAFNAYARDKAQTAHVILFFGSLALIPWKLLWKLGPFLLPLVFLFGVSNWRDAVRTHRLAALALFCHLGVLAVFVLNMQFISGRYFGPVLLLSVPFVALGLQQILALFPRWRIVLIGACVLVALANVLSFSNPHKFHFVEAGRWLAANHVREDPRVVLESARTAHYAGWKFSTRMRPLDRDRLKREIAAGRYDVVIFEVSRHEPDVARRLGDLGLREVRRFTDGPSDAVIVAEPISAAQESNRLPNDASSASAATSRE